MMAGLASNSFIILISLVALFGVAIVGLVLYYYRHRLPWSGNLAETLVERGLPGLLGDADALVLVPYEDGPLIPKRGYYDTSLLGDLPGYETADGDKFVIDGEGKPVYHFLGVPVVLALNPSEHASAVEPIKALIAQKDRLGEWVRVDRQGRPVEYGEAVEPVGDTQVTDGGEALAAPEKLYDLTPPAGVTEDGEIERATGYIVKQSRSADLLPRRISTEKVKMEVDKAENAAQDPTMKYVGYAAAAGFGAAVIMVGILWLMSIFSSGGGFLGMTTLLLASRRQFGGEWW